MAALYDLFRTPQPKGEKKVRYHARSVVTGKMTTRDLIKIQGRDIDTSRPPSGTFLFPCSGKLWSEPQLKELHTGSSS